MTMWLATTATTIAVITAVVVVGVAARETVDTDISAIKEPGRMPGSSSILFWLPRVYLLWSDILYL